MNEDRKRGLKRELKILIFTLFFGFLLYTDSTSFKSWKYPLELSPEAKKIEYTISIFIIFYGYLFIAGLRFLIYLLKRFLKYIGT
jgi:hypothetical protein